jgi:hypothetical protein
MIYIIPLFFYGYNFGKLYHLNRSTNTIRLISILKLRSIYSAFYTLFLPVVLGILHFTPHFAFPLLTSPFVLRTFLKVPEFYST